MNKKIIFFWFLFLLLIIPIASANDASEWYVGTNTTIDGDGSQENPFNNMDLALSHASDNDTVYVNEGTYTGAKNTNLTINHELTIQGMGNVVFDGNKSSRIFNVACDNVVLNGLTFINGNGSLEYGGAICWGGNNGLISNSVFENNYVDKLNYSYGGAVSVSKDAKLTIDNSTFKNNIAYGGGAIDSEGKLNVVNCYFEKNTAVNRDGGAISNVGILKVSNSTFVNNFASRNGGAIKNINGNLKVSNSVFIANRADGVYKDCYGGAIYQWDCADMEIYNSSFVDNYAARGAGAIFSHSGYMGGSASVFAYGCEFINNSDVNNAITLIATSCNVSNSVFINDTVYSNFTKVYFDNNWWGSNNPNWASTLVNILVPKSFAVLNFTANPETVKVNEKITLNADLVWNKTAVHADVPLRAIKLNATGGVLENNNGTLDFTTTFKSSVENDYTVYAYVDNEIQKVNVNVKNITSILTVPDVEMYYHDGTKLIIKLTDKTGKALANKNVTVTINGVTMNRVTDEKGIVAMSINLISNIYNVTTCYMEDNLTVNSILNVKSTISSSDIVKIFRNETQYSAKFVDAKGNLLTNANVTFNINGVFYTKTTNDKGIAGLNIRLYPGNYIITAINPVNGEQIGNKVIVKPNIADNKELVKYFRNASQYSVKLLNNDGSVAVEGEKVVFNINGVFYTKPTNASGIATLNINLNPGKYIVTAIYKECMVSNNITVLPTVIAKDGNITQGNSFVATVVDGCGNPLANQSVTFNINGVFYNKVSNDKGKASLNIRLNPGEYIISTYCNDCVISNRILVMAPQENNVPIAVAHTVNSVLKEYDDGYYAGTPFLNGDNYHAYIYDEKGAVADVIEINPLTGQIIGRG